MRKTVILISWVVLTAGFAQASTTLCCIRVDITSGLPATGNIPMDPWLDLGQAIDDVGGTGVLDPNSVRVINLATGQSIPFSLSGDFAHGNAGRVEWVMTDPTHTSYDVRFSTTAQRSFLQPKAYTPQIGTGDLLRYNAGTPRPIELPYSAKLVDDLTGDGKRDLIGTWNYAHRPGEPWDGVVIYPRVGDTSNFEFAEMIRLRYINPPSIPDPVVFPDTIYQSVAFADFNNDGLTDVVHCRKGSDDIEFYLNTGQFDDAGMPVFEYADSIDRQNTDWQPFNAADLNFDGKIDIVIGNYWMRNQGSLNSNDIPNFDPITATTNAGDARCYYDIDTLFPDAITLEEVSGDGLSNYKVAWRQNLIHPVAAFGSPVDITDIDSNHPRDVSAFEDGSRQGLLVAEQHLQDLVFYEQTGSGAQFSEIDQAKSVSAALGLGDQAWPCAADWDNDGDLDLLVGGGYGWPRILINDGTNQQPAYQEAQKILSGGVPIRITRNEVFYPGAEWFHDMGYLYPVYVDWDDDGKKDLVIPNETNRIFWYKNEGTAENPVFGPRYQLIVDGYPDSSTERVETAAQVVSENNSYPLEEDRPFFWRTGAAFADWNNDGLMDLITLDGWTRKATLFTQHDEGGMWFKFKKEVDGLGDNALRLINGSELDSSTVGGNNGWTESFRAVDWNSDGLMDLIYSLANQGAIYLLENVGTASFPVFDMPVILEGFGSPLSGLTNHGPHPWAGDIDGDGLPDILACTEWSVYPFYSHNALEMDSRPTYTTQAYRLPELSGGDMFIDFKDFAAFSASWLDTDCGVCDGADFDNNNNVDIEDLAILLRYWLTNLN